MQKVSEYAKNINDLLFLKEIGWLISSELVAAGIDINFAPVLDIDKNTSSIIGDRAFSDKADEVVLLASKFIDGMHDVRGNGKNVPWCIEDRRIDCEIQPGFRQWIMTLPFSTEPILANL